VEIYTKLPGVKRRLGFYMEKMLRKKIILPFLIFLLFISWAVPAEAGFGVSPPTIRNRQLTPGSTFKKEIRLLRSLSDGDLLAQIKIDAPEIDSWISIDKGEEFLLPKGELQVPMLVSFNIPKDAELGDYTGHINVRVIPTEDEKKGGVAIALGARIDIDLSLTNVSFADFLVRVVAVPDFERLGPPWNWKVWRSLYEKLFYKIKVVLDIENKGNIAIAPSKVTIDVYDISKKKLLQTSEDKSLKKIDSFSRDKIEALFPTKLSVGQYWSKVRIYKGSQVVNFYEIAFTVEEHGVLGKSVSNLGIWPWLVLGGLILIALLIILLFIKIRIWRYFIALIVIISRPSLKGITRVLKNFNKKFWKWVNHQAEKHKNDNKEKD